MKTIIGKTYISSDNSYSLNLTTGKECDYYLAGTYLTDPKEAIIVSKPYVNKLNNILGEKVFKIFINVEYNGETIRVLYRKENVNANLEYRKVQNRRWVSTLNY